MAGAPLAATRESHPLTGHADGAAIAAWRGREPVSAARFLAHVAAAAEALPPGAAVINLHADRYLFAVGLCAALVARRLTLLPPATSPHVLDAVAAQAPQACVLADDAALAPNLRHVALPPLPPQATAAFAPPRIPGEQVAARLFTSGSTGAPQPHDKTWASLVADARVVGRRLGIGARHALVGTVPPQHMYGLENTVMLALANGAALFAGRPFYPGDIDAAIDAVPAPRVLVTTPFHLRTWIEAGAAARPEIIVSATAPLSEALARDAEARTGAALVEIYGSTETGVAATRRTAREAEWRLLDGLRLAIDEAGVARFSGGHVGAPVAVHDVIEPAGDGARFVLRGRSADMVNIAGKRSSLAYLDRQLAAVPGVVDCAFFQPAEAAPDGIARLAAAVVAPGRTTGELLAELRERVDPAFLPRPLLLVDALPRQPTGKLPREALLALLAGARPSRTPAPRTETRLRFDAGHPAFDGHFPGRPIVPAVALLAEVMAAVEAATGSGPQAWTVAQAKFLAPVGPGTALTLVHEPHGEGGRRFEIHAGDARVAVGVLAPARVEGE